MNLSDKSIAQAFREYLPATEHADTQCLVDRILVRAREINAAELRALIQTPTEAVKK